ncbi:TPM domain-containing protein [Microbacterium sp. ASV49]|uniref:TPM domain-containing protein n=1 Tax=Microbacterium candidum TaxID=3041922 RepID=A0ABT7N161_9MICO|nr:TPM domain-containing protein [Microbacterium sp. ASV49]MDL9980432.1 TPM domain-containing protein [Microbacterium sp. ASV49]
MTSAIVAVVAAVAAIVLAFGPASVASAALTPATDPVTLKRGYVLDDSGVLTPTQEKAAQARLEKLSRDTGLDMWVVYVDSFTNPSSPEQWANQVAENNGLGPNQYLLAIATGSRQFYLSGDSAGPVSASQLSQIEQQDIQPKLANDDWLGAVDAAADGLTAAKSGAGGSTTLTVVLLIAAILAVGAVIWVLVARRRKARAVATAPAVAAPVDLEQLERDASAALVATDDAIRTSEQELGFATAQFGEAATTEFQAVLAAAKAALDEAFGLKQQLDDDEPDTDQERADWSTRILELCKNANDGLDEKAKAFDELRKLEQDPAGALARTSADRDAAAAAIDTATEHLAALAQSYAPEALATITDNVEQATQRLDFAGSELTAAQAAITGGDAGAAALHLRAAEEAVGQAKLLEQAIDSLGADLAAGETHAAALVSELDTDVATAQALPDPDGRVAGAIAEVQQAVAAARSDMAGTQKHPLAILQALDVANTRIDGVVQGIRDAAAQADRDRQVLSQQLLQAQAQVSAAEDYLTARRGAIGADARTRLAQAGAELVQAQQLQTTDAAEALAHAQRANQLASEALSLAQQDVGAFAPAGAPAPGGGGNMMGAVLGGIIINSLLSGGSRGGGFGGGFGGFGGSGGGFSPGSFGGGGTRGRRGGGRF